MELWFNVFPILENGINFKMPFTMDSQSPELAYYESVYFPTFSYCRLLKVGLSTEQFCPLRILLGAAFIETMTFYYATGCILLGK